MKHRPLLLITMLLCLGRLSFGEAQPQIPPTLQLDEAYALAEKNYPLAQNRDNIDELAKLNLEIIEKKRVPTINGVAEGKIQSENIEIGGDNPDSPLQIEVPRESFNAYIEANYNLYDGGRNHSERNLEIAKREVNQQQLTVTLRQLKDQVNALFFSIRLARQQIDIIQTSIADIEANLETLEVAYRLGVVLPSEILKLRVRKLELESQIVSEQALIEGKFLVLEELLGQPIPPDTRLEIPPLDAFRFGASIERPEQKLYETRQQLVAAQEEYIDASRLPTVSLFAQAGVGYPNPLNFVDTQTSPYGLGGIRLSWQLLDWGIARQERQKLKIQQEQIEVERQTFEFTIANQDPEFEKRIAALRQQIENDRQIVDLQEEVLAQSAGQLKNGVITATDYLVQVNATLEARRQQELHAVQLQKLQIEYLTLFGKL